jgi:hypothetical protein
MRAEINLLPLHLQPSILHGHEEHDLQANLDVNPSANTTAEYAEIYVSEGVSNEFSGSGTSSEGDSSLTPSPSGLRTSGALGSRLVDTSKTYLLFRTLLLFFASNLCILDTTNTD